jgi:hypothetical protein
LGNLEVKDKLGEEIVECYLDPEKEANFVKNYLTKNTTKDN